MLLCGSDLRFAFGRGLSGMVRLAGDAGFDGIGIGARCGRGDLAPLIAASLSAGLAVPVVAAPLPDGPLGDGRRLPYLASIDDGDERRAGVALFEGTLELAVPLGVRLFAVNLGELSLGTSRADVTHRFARRELEEGEPGARILKAAIDERRAWSGRVLDACRYALDRVLPMAERRDAILALEIAGDPWGLPGPREAEALVEEYRNGPLGVVWDGARMQVLTALGLGPSADRGTRLVAAARIWRANEAVGLEAGYLPGLGDPDGSTAEVPDAERPAGIPILVAGGAGSTREEVARARTLVSRSMVNPSGANPSGANPSGASPSGASPSGE